jgi:hypothetical protein
VDDLELVLMGTSHQLDDFLDIMGLQFWLDIADLDLCSSN